LIRNNAFSCQLGKILRTTNDVLLTLNQRVQGSSPCAPTKQNQALFEFSRFLSDRQKSPCTRLCTPF
jgi:hypothetical protein